MHSGILGTIGNTPLVRLHNLMPDAPFEVFGKLESFNPGGSVKDRAAYNMIRSALDQALIAPGWTVIESSSGNMGIGLAQICRAFGLHFVCVVDIHTTRQNVEILKAYGAQVSIVTEYDARGSSLLQARIERVQSLLRTTPRSWWPNQYANMANALAHHQTMREIVEALDGRVDYLFCATSTCGTVRGCADYIAQHGPPIRLIAVDAVGSVVFGGTPQSRLIPGMGSARRPELFRPDMVHTVVHIKDAEAIVGCRRLLHREAILAGGSSGAVVMALGKLQPIIPAGARCVLLLSDRGERYLDTIYSDVWVSAQFGDMLEEWHHDIVEVSA